LLFLIREKAEAFTRLNRPSKIENYQLHTNIPCVWLVVWYKRAFNAKRGHLKSTNYYYQCGCYLLEINSGDSDICMYSGINASAD